MRRLLIDLSSILRACHHVGTDHEFGRKVEFEGRTKIVNSATHAYENFMSSYSKALRDHNFTPRETVIVLDGRDSRAIRRAIFPGYKSHRQPMPTEFFEEYNEAVWRVTRELRYLGAACVKQDLMEADDVIAYLAQELEGERVVWSRDGDMLALMQYEGVSVLLKDELNPIAYKKCPAQFVTLYKALVGDSSDSFPGAKGFGEKAFFDMMMLFGFDGLDNLVEIVKGRRILELAEDVDEFKPLQKIVDAEEMVYTCWNLARFHIEKVNTKESPIEIDMRVAYPKTIKPHPLLEHFAPVKQLFADPEDLPGLVQELKKSPLIALDIETYAPEESEKWAEVIAAASNGRKKPENIVDVFGSILVGMSLTYGRNLERTVYLPVRHRDSTNLTSDQVAWVVENLPEGVDIAIHNTAFELPVLFNEWGGFIDGAVDTLLMNSYADENRPLGLKPSSKHYFHYQQGTYEETVTKEGPIGTLPPGGKQMKVFKQEVAPVEYEDRVDEETGEIEQVVVKKPEYAEWESRRYKMNELTAKEVFDYACDDTICSAALYNCLRLTLELEKTWEVFRECEIEAQYAVAQAFVDGIEVDYPLIDKLEAEDDEIFAEAKRLVDPFLIRNKWPGTVFVPFEDTIAGIKDAFLRVTGEKLSTRVRKREKLIAAVRDQGAEELAELLQENNHEAINEYLESFFVCEPEFEVTKKAHLRKILYKIMKCPVRFRRPPTDKMRAEGKDGTPGADKFAVDHAIKFDLGDRPEYKEVLLAIRTMQEVSTRKSLFYLPYRCFKHWKDGKIHPSLGQCRTATRRYAPSAVNVNQLPKRGDGLKVRQIIKAPEGYVYLAMDWSGQELRLAAFESQDENLLSCYVGDNLRDPHSITGASIAAHEGSKFGDYELFVAEKDSNKEVKAFRANGKGVNFSSQYLCRPPKLAKLLTVTLEEAEKFLDAKNAAYPGLKAWQETAIAEAHELGYAMTRLGARRHLHKKLVSREKYTRAEAERQAVNYRIQGSGAEMAKLAIKKMMPIFEETGAKFVMPIHDETITLIPEDKVCEVIPRLHGCMIQQYADVNIPLESEASIGYTLGNLVKIGTDPDENSIKIALERAKEAAV